MSDIYDFDKATGKYRLVRRHGQPDVPVRHAPLLTMEQIETTRHCPLCGEVYRRCHCAPPPPEILTARRAPPGRSQPGKPSLGVHTTRGTPRTFANAAHAALACADCGHISGCTCAPSDGDLTMRINEAIRAKHGRA